MTSTINIRSARGLLLIVTAVVVGGILSRSSPGADKAADAGESRRLAAIIANPKTPFDQKWEAADALRRCPPAQVYAALFDHIKPAPDANSDIKENVGWDARKREDLAKAPPEWQSSLLIARVWSDMAAVAKEGRGAIVAPLLPKATNDAQRFTVLIELSWDWAESGEAPVVKLMRDPRLPELQIVAARALMRNQEAKYCAEMRDNYLADEKLPRRQRMEWFEILAWHYPNIELGETDWDLKLLKLGFGLLEGEPTISHWQGETSSCMVAACLGDYMFNCRKFSPSPNDRKYRDANGNFTAEYSLDTIRNAKKWWAENEKRLMQHAGN